MDRQDVIKRLLYPKCKTASEFNYDNLIVNPLLSYISMQDIMQLNKIATSIKYSSKPKEKYAMIDNIMSRIGFKKMASGTNRVVYRCLNDYRVIIKIAIDKVGLSDNGNEYKNQYLLKPFVTKCFEVSPCGTVGLFERVVPITSREEFVNISDDIFDLINNIIGKYVLEDIGEKYFMNYGLREGFGPVLLDYPYVFELDGRKLICNVPEPFSEKGYCGGEIDYDLGYNNLICRKCGKRFLATELKSDKKSGGIKIIVEGEDTIMRCVLKRGDQIVSKLNSEVPVSTNTIKSREEFNRLTAQVKPCVVEEKEEKFVHKIKTHDDTQLKVRLRGKRTNKDIDAKARRLEYIEQMNTETIPVNMKPEEQPVRMPVSELSVSLNRPEPIKEEPFFEVQTAEEQNDRIMCEIVDGEILCNGIVIGYTKSHCDELVKEAMINRETQLFNNAEPNHNSPISNTFTTGVTHTTGYKTNDIVEPIEGHYSSIPVEEDKREIPELIIHPRRNDDDSDEENNMINNEY